MCTRLTGYFLTASVFIVVEACRRLANCSCKCANYFRYAKARGRDETRRDEATSTARRIDEFVGRVSATLQHHLPACFKPYLGIDPNFAAAMYSLEIPSDTCEWNFCRGGDAKIYPPRPIVCARIPRAVKIARMRVIRSPETQILRGRTDGGRKNKSSRRVKFSISWTPSGFFFPPFNLDTSSRHFWTSVKLNVNIRGKSARIDTILSTFRDPGFFQSVIFDVSAFPSKSIFVPVISTLSGDLPISASPIFPERFSRERAGRDLDFSALSLSWEIYVEN